MENLSLAMLRDSGLTLDWQTVYTGWQGFHSRICYLSDLSSEEVRDFAYESLAHAFDIEDRQALVGIIDAEAGWGFRDAMFRFRETLAARSGVPKELATQKWRYATMWHHVEIFLTKAVRYEANLPPEYLHQEDCFYVDHILYAIVPDWNALIPENQIPGIDPVYFRKEAFLSSFDELRHWLAEEGRRLEEKGQMARPSVPLPLRNP